jgi:hypothetical protein
MTSRNSFVLFAGWGVAAVGDEDEFAPGIFVVCAPDDKRGDDEAGELVADGTGTASCLSIP